MWRGICAGLIITTGLFAGCKQKDSDTASAPLPTTPALPDSVKPRATTQQLMVRVPLDLKYDPLTLMVPATWELKSFNQGTLVVLGGDTPTDTVGISLPLARKITNEKNVSADVKLKSLEAEAKADAAKYPDLYKGDVVRDIPGAIVIQQLTLDGAAASSGAATSPAADDSLQTMQWIFTVCVPTGSEYTAYELRFTGLTLKAYKADQQFLRSIIESLTYNQAPADAVVKP